MLNYSQNPSLQDSALPLVTFIPSSRSKITRVPKEYFTFKPSLGQQRYTELDIFRQQIEQSRAGLHHKPYTSNKRNVFLYKTIFFAFALIFAILGVAVLAVPSALGCGFFSSCTAIKSVLASLCTIFSLSAFTIAFSMSHEREVIQEYVRKARARLATIYARKCRRMGIKSIFAFFTHHRRQALLLRQTYHEACDKINDEKESALHLAHRIATAQTLDAEEKESLLNQAIEELNEKLMTLCHTFRHATGEKAKV